MKIGLLINIISVNKDLAQYSAFWNHAAGRRKSVTQIGLTSNNKKFEVSFTFRVLIVNSCVLQRRIYDIL